MWDFSWPGVWTQPARARDTRIQTQPWHLVGKRLSASLLLWREKEKRSFFPPQPFLHSGSSSPSCQRPLASGSSQSPPPAPAPDGHSWAAAACRDVTPLRRRPRGRYRSQPQPCRKRNKMQNAPSSLLGSQ